MKWHDTVHCSWNARNDQPKIKNDKQSVEGINSKLTAETAPGYQLLGEVAIFYLPKSFLTCGSDHLFSPCLIAMARLRAGINTFSMLSYRIARLAITFWEVVWAGSVTRNLKGIYGIRKRFYLYLHLHLSITNHRKYLLQ